MSIIIQKNDFELIQSRSKLLDACLRHGNIRGDILTLMFPCTGMDLGFSHLNMVISILRDGDVKVEASDSNPLYSCAVYLGCDVLIDYIIKHCISVNNCIALLIHCWPILAHTRVYYPILKVLLAHIVCY